MWTVERLMKELRKCPKHAEVIFADWAVVEAARKRNEMRAQKMIIDIITVHEVESCRVVKNDGRSVDSVVIATTGVVSLAEAEPAAKQ
jgi:hypothetical protein